MWGHVCNFKNYGGHFAIFYSLFAIIIVIIMYTRKEEILFMKIEKRKKEKKINRKIAKAKENRIEGRGAGLFG